MKSIALVSLGFVALLSSCVSGPQQLASQRPVTPAIRHNIADAARMALKDPYSVRDAEISQVMTATGGNYVCVLANSKNSFGAYEGRTGYTVFLMGDKPTGVSENNAWCTNPNIRYSKFTELENLKNL